MPKNPVIDLITDQEIAFAHLLLSGTMNDRSAAEAAGLNPDTAAYTRAKPCVRAYMAEHRAGVNRKLVDQQAEESSQYSIGRERILIRLWELASVSPEVTRGSMTGQMKALSMIVAIEGLIPDRRLARGAARPASAPAQPFIHTGKPHRDQTSDSEGGQPNDEDQQQRAPVPPQESPAASAADPIGEPAPAHVAASVDQDPNTSLNPFVHPCPVAPAPVTLENAFDLQIPQYSAHQQPLATRMAELRRGRSGR
jgi:hypothetical protein